MGIDPETGQKKRITKLLKTKDHKKAQLVRMEYMQQTRGGQTAVLSDVTLDHFAEKYLEAHKHQKDYANKRHRIESKVIPYFKDRPLDTLTTQSILEFRNTILGDKEGEARLKRQATANKYIQVLRHMIHWGVDQGYVPEDVYNVVRKIKKLPESKGRVHFFYKRQLKQLFKTAAESEECDGFLLPMIVLAAGTGIRQSDLLKLKWESVDTADAAGNAIYVGGETGYDTKGSQTHMVEIGGLGRLGLELARDWLLANKKPVEPDAWVIDWRSRDRIKYLVKREYPKLLAEAELNSKLTFHTIRHTYGTHALANGENIVNVRQWMGHANILTTQRYLHAVPRRRIETDTINPVGEDSDVGFRKVCYQVVTEAVPITKKSA
jgi:integrase